MEGRCGLDEATSGASEFGGLPLHYSETRKNLTYQKEAFSQVRGCRIYGCFQYPRRIISQAVSSQAEMTVVQMPKLNRHQPAQAAWMQVSG